MGDDLGADHATSASAVIDNDALAERFGHALRKHASEDIVGAARGSGNDHAYRLGRVVLRERSRP